MGASNPNKHGPKKGSESGENKQTEVPPQSSTAGGCGTKKGAGEVLSQLCAGVVAVGKFITTGVLKLSAVVKATGYGVSKVWEFILASKGAAIFLPAAGGAMFFLFPSKSADEWKTCEQVLEDSLGRQQMVERGGGYLESRDDLSMGMQPWGSMQIAVALMAERKLTPNEVLAIRAVLRYLDGTEKDSGWGYQEGTSPIITEIVGWGVLCRTCALNHSELWENDISGKSALRDRLLANIRLLKTRQLQDGGVSPIPLPSDTDVAKTCPRTYSTCMCMLALSEAVKSSVFQTDQEMEECKVLVRREAEWLIRSVDLDHHAGWVVNPSRRTPPYTKLPGLSGQVIFTVARAMRIVQIAEKDRMHFLNGVEDFLVEAEALAKEPTMPERSQISDLDVHMPGGVVLEGSTFLEYPWLLLSCSEIYKSKLVSGKPEKAARHVVALLRAHVRKAVDFAETQPPYVGAETLFALRTVKLND